MSETTELDELREAVLAWAKWREGRGGLYVHDAEIALLKLADRLREESGE